MLFELLRPASLKEICPFQKKIKKEWVKGACLRQKQGEGEMEKNEDMRRDIQWEDRRVSHRRI